VSPLQRNGNLISLKGSSYLIKQDFWRDYHNEKNNKYTVGRYFHDDFSGDLSQRRRSIASTRGSRQT
jgi:hypothetical protein